MNIFSNIGITELIIILLLALLVVGPERLPELGQKLGKILRDVRQAYENLTRDLGPEFQSIQKSTQELRESVESVRNIPQDAVKSVVKAAELEGTVKELRDVASVVEQTGQTFSNVKQTIQAPVAAAMSTAQKTLKPTQPSESVVAEEEREASDSETVTKPVEDGSDE
jgi:sec-independent protein translocase protein TatB